jgi:hypothetical protein
MTSQEKTLAQELQELGRKTIELENFGKENSMNHSKVTNSILKKCSGEEQFEEETIKESDLQNQDEYLPSIRPLNSKDSALKISDLNINEICDLTNKEPMSNGGIILLTN